MLLVVGIAAPPLSLYRGDTPESLRERKCGCLCLREREFQEREGGREGGRERKCVCMCVSELKGLLTDDLLVF